MKTTTTQQNNNRFDNGVSVAWLVEAEIDQYTGSALNVLYGSRAITINDGGTAYTYADSLPQRGSVGLGMASLRTRGGLASVAGATDAAARPRGTRQPSPRRLQPLPRHHLQPSPRHHLQPLPRRPLSRRARRLRCAA